MDRVGIRIECLGGNAAAPMGSTCKTTIKKKTLSPSWHEQFAFDAKMGRTLQVLVYDWDRLGSNDLCGTVTILLSPRPFSRAPGQIYAKKPGPPALRPSTPVPPCVRSAPRALAIRKTTRARLTRCSSPNGCRSTST